METTPPNNGAGGKEFQVTGISRSGRVRKKSSKLLDFQSPDELEKPPKPKRTPKSATRGQRGRPPLSDTVWRRKLAENVSSASLDDVATDDEVLNDGMQLNARLSESSIGGPGAIPRMTTDDDDDEDELDELVADIVEGVEAEAENACGESKVRQSLYMTEKANKKKMLKDGRIVTGKIQRKDKGKSRFTAYSLWAREFRNSSKFSTKQDLDFVNTARRLSELWANVPNNEKNIWRRKAKRLALMNPKPKETTAFGYESSNNATTSANANANNSFLNRATTSRTKKLAAEKQQLEQQQQKLPQENKRNSGRGGPGTETTTPGKRGRKPNPDKHSQQSTLHHNTSTTASASNTKSTHHNNSNYGTHLNTGPTTTQVNTASTSSSLTHIKLPMSGIEPIDAAAHLKLLGESLSIIGERLKEHEGQITVSGSLSVLLDSLLCSVGPLLCLTTRIPGLEKRKDLNENLTATLDNIAYVMPGL